MTVELGAAWGLWRVASCLERGGHFWTAPRGLTQTRACRCCPVMRRTCDVCRGEFQTSDDQRRRCSDACREFARAHKFTPHAHLHALWEREQRHTRPCPSGKVRHQKKADAEKAARAAARARYRDFPSWLAVYECEHCDGWHLTSKPRSRRPAARNPAA